VTTTSARSRRKPPVPLRYWVLWWFALFLGDLIFYVLLTPVWIGLRALAWVAEFRARRRELPPPADLNT
jgi:hypothetical protein